MTKRNQSGFSIIEILLILLAIFLLAGVGWYVWQARNSAGDSGNAYSADGKPITANKNADEEEDPTADWVSYSNKAGEFSFKHPKSWVQASKPELCSEGLALFGANKDSVGVCASESGGQMQFFSLVGNQDDEVLIKAPNYTNVKSSLIAINGIQGSRVTGTAQGQQTGDGPGGYPDGTEVVQYVFVANNNKTYVAQYNKQAGYPDALADFDTLVSETFKFTP